MMTVSLNAILLLLLKLHFYALLQYVLCFFTNYYIVQHLTSLMKISR